MSAPAPADRVGFAREYIDTLAAVMRDLPLEALGQALSVLEQAYRARRRVFLVGNGGSAATASHMASDLMWGPVQVGRPGFRAIALSDNVPILTAVANDRAYDDVFAVQLDALADPGDVLIAISGSGNSPNVVRAAEVARHKGLTLVGFLGRGGGKLAPMCDVAVVVPSGDYGPIEDLHMMFDHLCIAYLRRWAQAGCPER
jgi:D-sedoheptulose 7-phosphate isomerase